MGRGPSLLVIFSLFCPALSCLPTRGPDSYDDGSVVCPTGWARNIANRYCYYFNYNDLTWADAQAYCQSVGANLASITNRAENAFIFNQVYPQSPPAQVEFFLGGMTPTPGYPAHGWMWTDGMTFGYQNWAPGKPDNPGNDDHCLIIQIPTTAIGPNRDRFRWYDRWCITPGPSICKAPATIVG